MKKILILIFILSTIFLTSCWNEEDNTGMIIEWEISDMSELKIFNNN